MNCRSCGHDGLEPVLDLGETPLANSILTEAQLAADEPRFPLYVVFCPECSLVQLTLSVPPETIFSDYVYFSSFAQAVLDNAEHLVGRVVADGHLGPDSLVVEIASNDGYLLQHYVRAGIPVLGVDPAANIAPVAEEKGVRTLCAFFGTDVARELRDSGMRADVMHANNVMAHVPDLNGVVEGVKILLADDGVFYTESPYVKDLVEELEFDTIYHEHLCYYSLTALDHLYRRHGLQVHDAEHIPIHGGTMRAAVVHEGARPVTDRLRGFLETERTLGVDRIDFYREFASRVHRLSDDLRRLLADLKAGGARIAAYGAAAKGATLLNFTGIGTETLDYVVDRNTHKQGFMMPGVHLPIEAPERLLEDQPDYLLLLAWNFTDEIVEQQAEYARRGGQFIRPVPEPRIFSPS